MAMGPCPVGRLYAATPIIGSRRYTCCEKHRRRTIVAMWRVTTWVVATVVGLGIAVTLLHWTIVPVYILILAESLMLGWFIVRRRAIRPPAKEVVPAAPTQPEARAENPARIVERERIVERQVLVMHCKHCQQLTPVDLSECKSCGARLR